MNTDNYEEETEANEVQLLSVALTVTFLLVAPVLVVWQVTSLFF